jgi:hypothetical protein
MSLSQSFPIVSKLISKTRQLFSKSTQDRESLGTSDPAFELGPSYPDLGESPQDQVNPSIDTLQTPSPLPDEWPQADTWLVGT